MSGRIGLHERVMPQFETDDPWEALHRAIYVRARLDLIYAGQRWAEDAEAFFWRKGIDPAKVREAWAGRKKKGRPRRKG